MCYNETTSSRNNEEDNEENNIEASTNEETSNEKTEEEIEAEKTDAIAKELQDVPKIIKKKKVSKPEEMENPFKSEETENLENVIETTPEL